MKKKVISVTIIIVFFFVPLLYAQSREEMRRKLNPTCEEVTKDFDKMMKDLDLTDLYGLASEGALNAALGKLSSFVDKNFDGTAAEYYRHQIHMKRREKIWGSIDGRVGGTKDTGAGFSGWDGAFPGTGGLTGFGQVDQVKLGELLEQYSKECQEKQREISEMY